MAPIIYGSPVVHVYKGLSYLRWMHGVKKYLDFPHSHITILTLFSNYHFAGVEVYI